MPKAAKTRASCTLRASVSLARLPSAKPKAVSSAVEPYVNQLMAALANLGLGVWLLVDPEPPQLALRQRKAVHRGGFAIRGSRLAGRDHQSHADDRCRRSHNHPECLVIFHARSLACHQHGYEKFRGSGSAVRQTWAA